MGLSPFSSSGNTTSKFVVDSTKYSILKVFVSNANLMVVINYPNCTNYEGTKILIYKDYTLEQFMAQKIVDPHFSDNKDAKHPIARFEPTEEGEYLALKFLNSMK